MKKALMVASVASMIDQFNMPNIALLQELGYEVTVACNFVEGSTCDAARIERLRERLKAAAVPMIQIDFSRDVTDAGRLLRAYRQLRELLQGADYEMIHCHSPIGGLLTRLAARKYRKKGARVIYTAHGFHFFKGAPLKNWLLYFPVEWLSAFWTDTLITINQEDYAFAQKHMHAKRVAYVHGVGIDSKRFAVSPPAEDRAAFRTALGIGGEDKLLLSVGELNRNKNHELVIRALGLLGDRRIHYMIAGTGELHEYLMGLAEELGIAAQLHLLGFRGDVDKLYQNADLYVHPSLREGLSVALMEAIASKTPVICSAIRGNRDLVDEKDLFECRDVNALAEKIHMVLAEDHTARVAANYERLRQYDLDAVRRDMEKLYLR